MQTVTIGCIVVLVSKKLSNAMGVGLVHVLLYGGAECCVLVEGGVGKVHLCHTCHCVKVLRPVAHGLLQEQVMFLQ